ncbi:MAG: T9SS type A sorting domain-containing protein [Bacteroidota bacterium]|nr:T9SS type A sorting domain-containing protein [Bacteroidota bacterium]
MRYLYLSVLLLFTGPLANAQWALYNIKNSVLMVSVQGDGSIGMFTRDSISRPLMFSQNLWMSGMDPQGQHDYSAQAYYFQNNYHAVGPVSTSTNGNPIYNTIHILRSSMIDSALNGYYGSNLPQEIIDWPAHGDTAYDEPYRLAPFHDLNFNGTYEPQLGEVPAVKGDISATFIFNNALSPQSGSVNATVVGTVYMYDRGNYLDSMYFVDYQVIREDQDSLLDFRASIFSDYDVGSGWDDLVGTLVDLNATFGYNGTANDTSGPWGFGRNYPTVATVILKGLDAPFNDGLDNDRDGCTDGVRDSSGNCVPETGYDREYWRLSNSIYYFNGTIGFAKNPVSSQDHFNYFRNTWVDGTQIAYDSTAGFLGLSNSDGHGFGTRTNFVFPGNSIDPTGVFPFAPSQDINWFQSPDDENDQRVLAGLGTTTLYGDDRFQLSFAQAYVLSDSARGFSDHGIGHLIDFLTRHRSSMDSIWKWNYLDAFLSLDENPVKVPTLRVGVDFKNSEWILQNNTKGPRSFEIIDLFGRIVKQGTLDEGEVKRIDTYQFASGVYIIRTDDGWTIRIPTYRP